MQIKTMALVLPGVLLGTLATVSPAEAITFSLGDTINLTGSVHLSGSEHRFTDVGGTPQAVGNYGNFGVQNGATGGFAAFATNGAIKSDYHILSVDFADSSTYLNQSFLQASISDDQFTFEITSAAEGGTVPLGSGLVSGYSLNGVFKNLSGTVLGKGLLTANSFGQGGSFSSTFIVTENTEDVPEPTSILALITLGGGLAARLGRRAMEA